MQTMLLQSYRSSHIPSWIMTCMTSAKNWAEKESWSYCFIDDDLFEFVPAETRRKFFGYPQMLSDIARLAWAKQVFMEDTSVDRILWLDADIIIFAPETLDIAADSRFAVGRQVWVQPGQGNKLKIYRQVHNACLLAGRDTPVLDFLLYTVLRTADRLDQISSPQMFGPKLLTALHNIVGFDVIEGIGMASPLVLQDLVNGDSGPLGLLQQSSKVPIGALNLCGSYRNKVIDGVVCNDELFDQAIAQLCERQGGLF